MEFFEIQFGLICPERERPVDRRLFVRKPKPLLVILSINVRDDSRGNYFGFYSQKGEWLLSFRDARKRYKTFCIVSSPMVVNGFSTTHERQTKTRCGKTGDFVLSMKIWPFFNTFLCKYYSINEFTIIEISS